MIAFELDERVNNNTLPPVKWKDHFIPIIKEILKELAADGEKPSVRGMWYILVSRYPDKISNIPSMYSSYDKAITKARKREYDDPKRTEEENEKNRLDEDAFVDNVREIIDIDDIYETPDEYLQRYIDPIKEADENYTIPRWYKQPNYVEVLLEKDAVVSMFESMLHDKEVRIVPNRGWTSVTFVAKNIVRLWNKRNKEEIKHVYVLYAGDYDPSGLKMDDILKKEIFKKFRKYWKEAIERSKKIKEENRIKVLIYLLSTIHFERIAITKSQIEEFNLQHLTDPDAKTRAKLEGTAKKKGDSNTEWFKLKHGDGRVYQIELDAMHARREQFKRFLLSTVDQHFDNEIYEREVKQPQERARRSIRALANQMIDEQFPLEEDGGDDDDGGQVAA